MLRPFPQYSGGDRRLRRRRAIHLSFAAADRREAAVRRWADREFQLHVQPHRRTISPRGPATTSTRTGPSASTISRTSGTRWSSTTCRLARTGSRAAAIRSSVRSSRTGRSPGSRSSGRAVRWESIGAACNLPNAGTCYADFNPGFSGAVRINGDYGDGDVLGTTPPAYIDRNAFQSPAPFTFGNTPRTLAFDLRNPSYFNQDLSVRRDFPHRQDEARARRRRVQRVQHGRLRRDPDQHHQRELRQGELAGEHAARRRRSRCGWSSDQRTQKAAPG